MHRVSVTGAVVLAGCCRCGYDICVEPDAIPSYPDLTIPTDSVFHTMLGSLPDPLYVRDLAARTEREADVVSTDFGFTIVPNGLEPGRLYRIEGLTDFETSDEVGLPPPPTLDPLIEHVRQRPLSHYCCRYDADFVRFRWDDLNPDQILGWQIEIIHADTAYTTFTSSATAIHVGDSPTACVSFDITGQPQFEYRLRPYGPDGQFGAWTATSNLEYDP